MQLMFRLFIMFTKISTLSYKGTCCLPDRHFDLVNNKHIHRDQVESTGVVSHSTK
jgi:hypothetical protein